MKVPYGPHRRARRRRRVGKALTLVVLVTALAAAASMTTDRPEPKDTPTPQQVAYAHNLYKSLGGACGEAKVYIDRWPEYADEIMGG